MKKPLNTSTIENELKAGSAFFKTPRDRTPSDDRSNGHTEREHRTVRDNASAQSVLDEMNQGVREPAKRPTERYSFEIYTDQKQQLRELQYQYEKRTGQRLSTSRIIREAIAVYLDKALAL